MLQPLACTSRLAVPGGGRMKNNAATSPASGRTPAQRSNDRISPAAATMLTINSGIFSVATEIPPRAKAGATTSGSMPSRYCWP